MDDHFGKLNEESDLMYKRCGALNKKEHRGCDSPDPDASYVLTPHTEEKYKKINEEFDNMMRNHKIPSALPQQNFSMHVAVPVSNPNAMYQPGAALGSQALAAATASLSDNGMLSPPQASVHRNLGSGGGPQRPTSEGSAGGMLDTTDFSVPSGVGPSPVGNGFVNPRGSPGILSSPSGNGLGKVMPTKSPPPPGGNMGMGSRKPDLRVLIPPSSKGMMPPLMFQKGVKLCSLWAPLPSSSRRDPGGLEQSGAGWKVSARLRPEQFRSGLRRVPAVAGQSEEEEMDLNAQRISSSQSAQPLATPVVSVTTPSLAPQGLVYSSMPTSYNPADFSLNSAEISSLQGFGSPGLSLGSMSAWQQHQLGQAALNSLVGGGQLPQGSNLSLNTSQHINIKSEPNSPPRERVTPSGFPPQQPQQGSSRQEVLGRSPADSLSSSCSSYDGSDREDHRPDFNSPLGLARPPVGNEDRASPSVKRLRMDSWVT
ncbi:Myocyte-specific enhancer factor 2A [Takifugu flavidus]|uniref:Myocyte-specific enhancer factor 2A n=1 Tax=Takifugu flavidus TaxID=433684 RepID=A0A5C6PA47_9TELE|nr:Myocyte-specific enhancer factor 2A [Takifugu flavidus]